MPHTRQFDVKIEPVEPKDLPYQTGQAGVRITVTAKPGLPVGRFNQWLPLKTNHADAEKLALPVLGQVVGDISVHGTGWSEEEGVLMIGQRQEQRGQQGAN